MEGMTKCDRKKTRNREEYATVISSSFWIGCIFRFQQHEIKHYSCTMHLPMFSVTVIIFKDIVDSVIVLKEEHCNNKKHINLLIKK
jgi:hypothetical protein